MKASHRIQANSSGREVAALNVSYNSAFAKAATAAAAVAVGPAQCAATAGARPAAPDRKSASIYRIARTAAAVLY
jgi:hypothetical protein